MNAKDWYEEMLRHRLNMWQPKIDWIKSRAEDSEADNHDYYFVLSELSEKEAIVQEKLIALQQCSDERWKQKAPEIESAWEDLGELIDAVYR